MGLAKACWVKVEVGPGGPVCHLVGPLHRRPVESPIPLATATRLMAAGVPSVVRHGNVHRPLAART